jgi:molecular chaperone GrpE
VSTTEEKKTDAEAGEQKEQAAAAAAAATPAESDEKQEASDKSEEDLEIEVEAPEEPEAEPDPLEELKAKVAELEKGKKTNYDRFLRATADLENYRKRSRRDVKDARLDERGKILRDMLPVIDNLDRAVAHAEQNPIEETKSIIEGVNLVLRQFKQALERHKVTPLDAVGTIFDPTMHEAVSQGMTNEHPPGTVISVLQTGYMMEERLLRPALVVVAVAMPTDESEAKDEDSGEEAVEASSESSEEASDSEDSSEESAEESTEESAEESTEESSSDESSEDDSAEESKADAEAEEKEEPSEDKE